MIDLPEEIHRVNRVGILARLNRRTRVTDVRQPRVYRADALREDRYQSRLVEQALLEVGEEERPIALDGAAKARAVLRLTHRQRGPGQRVWRIETIVPHVVVEVAVRGVAAALRDDVDVAAERAAELGLAARRHDLKLVDSVHTVRDAAQPCRVVVGRQAVHDEVVREVALAAHRQAHARNGGRFREKLRAADVGRRDAGHEQRHVQEVAAVHRQRLDLGMRDRARDLAAGSVEHRERRDDVDGSFDGPDLEHHRQVERRAQGEGEPSRRVGEARVVHGDFVRADPQVREAESAFAVGGRRCRDVRVDLARGDLRARDDGAGRIGHTTAHAGEVDGFLSEHARCGRQPHRYDTRTDLREQQSTSPAETTRM